MAQRPSGSPKEHKECKARHFVNWDEAVDLESVKHRRDATILAPRESDQEPMKMEADLDSGSGATGISQDVAVALSAPFTGI